MRRVLSLSQRGKERWSGGAAAPGDEDGEGWSGGAGRGREGVECHTVVVHGGVGAAADRDLREGDGEGRAPSGGGM